MSIVSHNIQNKEKEKFPNEFDKLLSDKYILAKEIRDLNKTLEESLNRMNDLEFEVKNKLILKVHLDKYINSIDEIQKQSGLLATNVLVQSKINELIEKFNTDHELLKLMKTLKIEIDDFVGIKQFLMKNALILTDELKILQEKTEKRNNVNSEALVERDHLKEQLKNIEEEIADLKRKEDQ